MLLYLVDNENDFYKKGRKINDILQTQIHYNVVIGNTPSVIVILTPLASDSDFESSTLHLDRLMNPRSTFNVIKIS